MDYSPHWDKSCQEAKEKANNTVVDLVTIHFCMLGTTATEKVKIFHDLVIVVDKNTTVTEEPIHLKHEAHKYNKIKAELELRK